MARPRHYSGTLSAVETDVNCIKKLHTDTELSYRVLAGSTTKFTNPNRTFFSSDDHSDHPRSPRKARFRQHPLVKRTTSDRMLWRSISSRAVRLKSDACEHDPRYEAEGHPPRLSIGQSHGGGVSARHGRCCLVERVAQADLRDQNKQQIEQRKKRYTIAGCRSAMCFWHV